MILVALAAVLFLPLVPMRERDAVAYCVRMASIAYPDSRPEAVITSWKPESRSWYVRIVDREGRVAHCEVGSGYLRFSFSISYEAPAVSIGPDTAAGPDDVAGNVDLTPPSSAP